MRVVDRTRLSTQHKNKLKRLLRHYESVLGKLNKPIDAEIQRMVEHAKSSGQDPWDSMIWHC